MYGTCSACSVPGYSMVHLVQYHGKVQSDMGPLDPQVKQPDHYPNFYEKA